ncbi:MAG: molecular chaperone [Tateyamaria sp.]|jgi:fimbrial chaperone protein|nr:molecular chaperone [Tateyamaria sp.]
MLVQTLKQAARGLFFFVACSSVASAGAIGVNPVRVTLSNEQKVGTISVSNNGTEPVTIQVQLLSWSQEGSNAVFTATRDILSNPPIFTISAGDKQLVRVGLRRPPDAQREQAYRIFLQELPSLINSGETGAKMLMRISLPVFVLPEVEAKSELRWQVSRTPQGALKISLTNNGNAHIQIRSFQLFLPDSIQPWVTLQSSDYVLSDQSRDWILPINADNPIPLGDVTLQLVAQTDIGQIKSKVLIAP